jgi:monoamine oxidase
MGSYIKVHVRLQPAASKLWAHHGPDVFTLLTDRLCGAIYNSTDHDVTSSSSSSWDKRDLTLTLLLHGKLAKQLIDSKPHSSDSAIEDHTRVHMEKLFPGISRFIDDIEIFTFPNAVAYWPIREGRSRFDHLANVLRQPFGVYDTNQIYIAGDTTFGSHSEGAGYSALTIAKRLIHDYYRHHHHHHH